MSSARSSSSTTKKKTESSRVKKATETFSIYEPKVEQLKDKIFESAGRCSFTVLQVPDKNQKIYYPSHFVHTAGIDLRDATNITEEIKNKQVYPLNLDLHFETLEIIRPFYLDSKQNPWYPSLPPPVPPVQIVKESNQKKIRFEVDKFEAPAGVTMYFGVKFNFEDSTKKPVIELFSSTYSEPFLYPRELSQKMTPGAAERVSILFPFPCLPTDKHEDFIKNCRFCYDHVHNMTEEEYSVANGYTIRNDLLFNKSKEVEHLKGNWFFYDFLGGICVGFVNGTAKVERDSLHLTVEYMCKTPLAGGTGLKIGDSINFIIKELCLLYNVNQYIVTLTVFSVRVGEYYNKSLGFQWGSKDNEYAQYMHPFVQDLANKVFEQQGGSFLSIRAGSSRTDQENREIDIGFLENLQKEARENIRYFWGTIKTPKTRKAKSFENFGDTNFSKTEFLEEMEKDGAKTKFLENFLPFDGEYQENFLSGDPNEETPITREFEVKMYKEGKIEGLEFFEPRELKPVHSNAKKAQRKRTEALTLNRKHSSVFLGNFEKKNKALLSAHTRLNIEEQILKASK